MRIGQLDSIERVIVVAEIGNNHEGDPRVAAEMVRAAAGAGVHAVKFQTFRTEHYVGVRDERRYAQLKSFELSYEQFEELAELAHSLGLAFLSTPFDLESARFLARAADALKVASGDNTFYPLLREVAASDRPVIVSTGLADVEVARRAVDEIRSVRGGDGAGLALLHAVTSYPVPPEDANLRAIPHLAEQLGVEVGYSDHVIGNDAALAAVALGARIVEKHFTLEDIDSDFRDHALSATPSQMAELVRRIGELEPMLGAPEKTIRPAEEPLAVAVRRSVVAAADLPPGHELRPEDLTWVRPGGGLAPGDEHLIVGRRLARPVAFGERLAESDVES